MRLVPTEVSGAYIVELEERTDERGFFARAFCVEEFGALGLETQIAQANISYNRHAGTIRGLHWQAAPALEAKYFRCTRGAAHHVAVDVRPDSSTYLRHIAVELSGWNRLGLVVPAECATGYQTLEDDTEVFYLVSGFYSPEHERGLRHDDPALGIAWPRPHADTSEKDRSWPLLAASKEIA
ncbi:MAG: dTDP-4-dehydrorhamnose 3,5-epimerase family protein [Actinomycetota bacterium]|nr:dTDP-4-dehydrorhamnose 3,5-epimerase family protein [Actinomycetota bacterium]